jgi:hypothetical protein
MIEKEITMANNKRKSKKKEGKGKEKKRKRGSGYFKRNSTLLSPECVAFISFLFSSPSICNLSIDIKNREIS